MCRVRPRSADRSLALYVRNRIYIRSGEAAGQVREDAVKSIVKVIIILLSHVMQSVVLGVGVVVN